MKRRRPLTPREIAVFSHRWSDPTAKGDFKIANCLAGAEEGWNPFFAWLAIEICIDQNREFPDLILSYLKQCAERMRSEKALDPEGLSEELPWVLGFKLKRGRGNLLDPDQGRPELCFVLQFSAYVCRGDDPDTALDAACNKVWDEKTADKANKATMQAWVKRHYDLETWQHTPDEWQKIISQYYPGEELAIWLDTALRYYKNLARK